jgi:hypothetical protein
MVYSPALCNYYVYRIISIEAKTISSWHSSTDFRHSQKQKQKYNILFSLILHADSSYTNHDPHPVRDFHFLF